LSATGASNAMVTGSNASALGVKKPGSRRSAANKAYFNECIITINPYLNINIFLQLLNITPFPAKCKSRTNLMASLILANTGSGRKNRLKRLQIRFSVLY
jgi:hypothetical protein